MINPEKHFKDTLPLPFQQIAEVDLRYSSVLRTINGNLKRLYGERANWQRCLDKYNQGEAYPYSCRVAYSVDDIPQISTEDIYKIVQKEDEAVRNIAELNRLREVVQEASSKEPTSPQVLRAAELLGITPILSKTALNQWLIDRSDLRESEIHELENKMRTCSGEVCLIISQMMDAYHEAMIYRFPIVGITITQPKCRYFYRGENAFYGSSKPSLFRKREKNIPEIVDKIIKLLRLNEGCAFWDKMAAVNQWSISDVNHLALCQHYGLPTQLMDLTTDLRTAIFFACCKWGKDGKWHPLTKDDFSRKESRQDVYAHGGDSRYGILYRMPTDINDMRLVQAEDNIQELSIPIGYQPFMRCSSQHGYMWYMHENSPDLLKDVRFSKVRFRLDEELTYWIYREMEEGNRIYPNHEFSDVAMCMQKIAESKTFSRSVFNMIADDWKLSQTDRTVMESILNKHGYIIAKGEVEHISAERLNIINRTYTAQKVFENLQIQPVQRPMLLI